MKTHWLACPAWVSTFREHTQAPREPAGPSTLNVYLTPVRSNITVLGFLGSRFSGPRERACCFPGMRQGLQQCWAKTSREKIREDHKYPQPSSSQRRKVGILLPMMLGSGVAFHFSVGAVVLDLFTQCQGVHSSALRKGAGTFRPSFVGGEYSNMPCSSHGP